MIRPSERDDGKYVLYDLFLVEQKLVKSKQGNRVNENETICNEYTLQIKVNLANIHPNFWKRKYISPHLSNSEFIKWQVYFISAFV